MGSYIINVENPTGDKGSVVPDVELNYTEFLNTINSATLKFSGTGSVKRTLLVIGSKVEIKRNGTREFYGLIDSVDTLDSGAVVAYVSGYEIWLAKEKGTYASSPWKNTASATINTSLIGESSYFSAGTVEAGTNIDFRIHPGESIWTGLSNLKNKTTQDIGVDYVNTEIDILDHKGSSTSVMTLNDGTSMRNVRVSETYPAGNKIRVYGKGDGDVQITATANNAASIAAYGPITRDVTDKSIMSTSEAQKLADAELAISKDPTKIYDFEVVNPDQSIVAGDVITLNSTDKDLSDEEVRVTAIQRGLRGTSEFLQLQVCNKAYSKLIATKNKVLARIEKNNRDSTTYMDGTSNVLTWSRGLNAKSGVPMRLPFYVPSSFIEDEAGNLRVKSMTLDYDVDPYRKGVGGATDSGHQHSDPSQTSSTYTLMSSEGTDTFSNTSLNVGWNNNQMSASISAGTYDFLSLLIILHCDFSNGDFDVGIRVHFNGNYYVGRYNMNASTAISTYVIRETFLFPIFASIASPTNIYVDVYSSVNNQYDGWLYAYSNDQSHSHSISTHNVDSNTANVTIGDSVSDAGAVNASEVDIYLDFWNGAAWINKHSIINTGKTLDTDVDITNSDTYPDAAGYWRVRIDPDHATPDYMQGIVKLKHQLDS